MRAQARAAVKFSVLGPLAATYEGEPLALGGERQRALLAMLLVHAGELVATERLTLQLFGARRSATALNGLHVAVSRLRRALRDGDGAMLHTRRGGYVLELEPDQLDAAVFERGLEQGRGLLAAGDAVGATARLAQALALWRGPPLADLAGMEDIQGEIRRLEELRLLAEMERIDAQLALGRAAEAVGELERLIAAAPLQERLRGQLMVALYRSGRQADALAAYRETCGLLREELGLTPSAELRELEQMILRHDSKLELEHPAPATTRPMVCPFKGLAAFESSDADYFCGRDRTISELIARLAEWSLVGILGSSGIGKSSLLRAGVLPALRAGALPGSARWRQVLLRPGARPVDELERSLDAPLEDALREIERGGRLVIAVDQLEEIFTVCQHEAERGEFLARLAAAAGDYERRALLLCTMRADFYGRLSAYPGFAELISRSHVLVGPMDRDELREAIERPAARAGLEVEGRLVDVLVAEVADEPGTLPLLQTTLLELWQGRDGHALRLQDYRATGGVRSGVARIAESAYLRLGEAERALARDVLLRLADGGDGPPERRQVPLAELSGIEGVEQVLGALTQARLLTVGAGTVELSHEALLREWPRYRGWLEEDRVGRRLNAHLRVAAHEWAGRGRDAGELYRGARLAAAMEFAAEHSEQLGGLEREFVEASRSEAEREASRQRVQNRRLRGLLLGVGALLVLTVVAGVVAVVGQQRASSDARLAVAEARAALGRQLGEEALTEPRLDVAALLARQSVALDRSPQSEGTLLSILLRSPSVIAAYSLPANSTPHVAVSPDGRELAVSDSVSNSVQLYDTRTRARVGTAVSDFFGDQPPSYSPDGSLLAYRTGGSIAVRDARTLSLRERLAIGPPFAPGLVGDMPQGSVLIAPDDSTLYYGYWTTDQAGAPAEAYLARWSLTDGRPEATVALGRGPLLAIALADRGRWLVIVTPRVLERYDAGSLRAAGAVGLDPAPMLPSSAAVSPDGASVVIGSRSGSVWFADGRTGALRRAGPGHSAAVASVVYAPNGRAITVGDDGEVLAWAPGAGTVPTVMPGPPGRVQDAEVSPDGSTLYTSAVGGVLLAWDLTGRRGFGRTVRLDATLPCCDPVAPAAPALAVSPDGSRFAVAVGPSAVGVFSMATLRRETSFAITPQDDPITALAWSPDGGALALGAHDGVVQVWGLAGSPRIERMLMGLAPLPGQPEAIQSLAFSPDGRLLAASDKVQTATIGHTLVSPLAALAIWHVDTGSLVAAPADLGAGNGGNESDAVAFSRTGKLLAASLLAGGVRLFDPASQRIVRTIPDPGDDSTALAFGANGALAAGTFGGTVELWSSSTGRRLAAPLLVDSSPISGVAFDSPGERLAVTGQSDGSVRVLAARGLQQEGPRLAADPGSTAAAAFDPRGGELLAVDDHGGAFTWPMSLGAWQQQACSVAGRELTRAEWSQFVGGPGYGAVCP